MDVSNRQEGLGETVLRQQDELGGKDMKYILLMSGTKAGVDTYHAWSQKDIETHMAVLRGITNDLTRSGEFLATQGLAEPAEGQVVRREENAMAGTDGIFPESKRFLLGYW